MRRKIFLLIMVWTGFGSAGAAGVPMPKSSKAPIEISADNLSVDAKQHRAVYTGNVEMRQEDMLINAQKMVVEGQGSAIQRVVATGNPVRMRQLNRRSESRQMVFEPQQQIITLTGAARVWQDKDEIMGERIVYHVKQQRTEVSSGGHGRVRTVFYPKQQTGATAPTDSAANTP